MEKRDCLKLPGAKFVLLDGCGREIACGVTNRCGEILFEDLPLGRYFIKEIEAPCGFKKSEEICEVEISCNRSHACIEVINEKRKGSIRVLKLGKD